MDVDDSSPSDSTTQELDIQLRKWQSDFYEYKQANVNHQGSEEYARKVEQFENVRRKLLRVCSKIKMSINKVKA